MPDTVTPTTDWADLEETLSDFHTALTRSDPMELRRDLLHRTFVHEMEAGDLPLTQALQEVHRSLGGFFRLSPEEILAELLAYKERG